MSRISSTDHVMPIVPTTVMITWKCEVAIANDSGASHITKAIVSITVEETRLQKNNSLTHDEALLKRRGRGPGGLISKFEKSLEIALAHCCRSAYLS
jgi:hypothetical protein